LYICYAEEELIILKIYKIMVVILTDANFEEMVLKAEKPVLVDFWAEWCGPCRVIGPLVQEIAEDYKEKVIVGKLDVDSNPAVSSKYGIRNIPTVLFFKNGVVADKQVGAVPKGNLVNKVEALL
jgi:thioredoxin 1